MERLQRGSLKSSLYQCPAESIVKSNGDHMQNCIVRLQASHGNYKALYAKDILMNVHFIRLWSNKPPAVFIHRGFIDVIVWLPLGTHTHPTPQKTHIWIVKVRFEILIHFIAFTFDADWGLHFISMNWRYKSDSWIFMVINICWCQKNMEIT